MPSARWPGQPPLCYTAGMSFLKPSQSVFYDLFSQIGDDLVEISGVLEDLARHFKDFRSCSVRAEALEHRADERTHEIIDQLNKAFVTPFDREDVYQLAHELDEIVDRIEDVIKDLHLYNFQTRVLALEPFSKLIAEAVSHVRDMLAQLPAQKHTDVLHKHKIRIHDLEDEGDALFYQEIRKLFEQNVDPILIIKTKDILEGLEDVMDKCQAVSNLIEGIVIKSS